MSVFSLEKISDMMFARFHAIYGENIFMEMDWQGRLDTCAPEGCGCLIKKHGAPVGGAVCREGEVSSPFLIPPFSDICEFWHVLLSHVTPKSGMIRLSHIPCTHGQALVSLGAVRRSGQYRMIRPTEPLSPAPCPGYELVSPSECERDEIIRVIYEAHCSGYTSVVNGRPAIEYVRYQTGRRFTAFSKTGTLDMGAIARCTADGAIAGVCLAGIYPDSCNDFATVHQLSVHPAHRNRGLGRMLLMEAVSRAYKRSPAISLGVLAGNPAMALYESVGFMAGCEYGDYEYRKI